MPCPEAGTNPEKRPTNSQKNCLAQGRRDRASVDSEHVRNRTGEHILVVDDTCANLSDILADESYRVAVWTFSDASRTAKNTWFACLYLRSLLPTLGKRR
jgi:hypothetical protein